MTTGFRRSTGVGVSGVGVSRSNEEETSVPVAHAIMQQLRVPA